MKIAVFHNASAGDRTLKGSELVRQFGEGGYDVLYVSTKEEGWESAFRSQIDRAVVAGGDGTVSRLAPWLSATGIPFCILPLGTANNCAQTLDQMQPLETVVSRLGSAPIKKVDLGLLTSPAGHRVFIESIGLGLLASFMRAMRVRERKHKTRDRLTPQERLSNALQHLCQITKEHPEAECDLLLDDEPVRGSLLLLEIANMRLIGPNLKLVPDVDPTDGRFEVVWIPNERRKEWRNHLKLVTAGESSAPPVSLTRCTRVLFRNVNAPVHIDSKVFPAMLAPISVKPHPGTLDLVDLSAG
jgi:diacylglycerol kinase (ATP)